MSEKIKPHHLERKAILYVRQSSAYQVNNNLESQKLQYAMEERLRTLGWREVEVVDEHLGRSASGSVMRAGFERMVTEVCLGQIGAVAAREVSRFARNNRDFAGHLRPTSTRAGSPAPVKAKACAMPPDDVSGLTVTRASVHRDHTLRSMIQN